MKILYNARIHTLDPLCPQASVIAIDGERVVALGGQELLDGFSPFAGRQDMGGRAILPGLTDAHLHLEKYALGLQKLDVGTKTKDECLRRVAERDAQIPAGKWLLGHGWQHNDWQPPVSSPRRRRQKTGGGPPPPSWMRLRPSGRCI
jgi:predicted amidohydrolase YtcJ